MDVERVFSGSSVEKGLEKVYTAATSSTLDDRLRPTGWDEPNGVLWTVASFETMISSEDSSEVLVQENYGGRSWIKNRFNEWRSESRRKKRMNRRSKATLPARDAYLNHLEQLEELAYLHEHCLLEQAKKSQAAEEHRMKKSAIASRSQSVLQTVAPATHEASLSAHSLISSISAASIESVKSEELSSEQMKEICERLDERMAAHSPSDPVEMNELVECATQAEDVVESLPLVSAEQPAKEGQMNEVVESATQTEDVVDSPPLDCTEQPAKERQRRVKNWFVHERIARLAESYEPGFLASLTAVD
mmetsp:Transcript_37188/g.37865  ORF Transcript_37188/g.37865 Transcript_37188/m.37865 type:complete len:305 (-) Transcript_37188:994-1908(-)